MTVMLVTGAAKRIGKSIAQQCAASGNDIAVHYKTSRAEAQTLVNELSSLYPKQIFKAFQADLSKVETIPKLILDVIDSFGYCDVLINNASTFTYDNLANATPKSWDLHNDVNIKAPLFLAKYFVEQFQKTKTTGVLPKNTEFGHIINIIDQRVWNLTPHFLTYSLSKSALWALTQTLALDLAPGFRVNAIGPGPTLKSIHQTEELFQESIGHIPLKKSISLYDFGRTIEYLIKTPSITGQMIALDAGQHLGWSFPRSDKPEFID